MSDTPLGLVSPKYTDKADEYTVTQATFDFCHLNVTFFSSFSQKPILDVEPDGSAYTWESLLAFALRKVVQLMLWLFNKGTSAEEQKEP